MSIWTDGLPAWWAMVVAVAALIAGVLLGELHGRGVVRGQVREDRAAARAARQVRSWREPGPAIYTPPAYAQEAAAIYLAKHPVPPEVAHETFLSHAELAMDIGNDGQGIHLAPADAAFLDMLHADMNEWLTANVYKA
jgi:hypothetical protein